MAYLARKDKKGEATIFLQETGKRRKEMLYFMTFFGIFVSMSISVVAAGPCSESERGTFAELSSTRVEFDRKYLDEFQLPSRPTTHQWPLDPIDEVKPTYKFQIFRSESVPSQCDGLLVTPFGNVFEFSSMGRSDGAVTFKTIERRGMWFEGEFKFLDRPLLQDGTFVYGRANIRAFIRNTATAQLAFPFTGYGQE